MTTERTGGNMSMSKPGQLSTIERRAGWQTWVSVAVVVFFMPALLAGCATMEERRAEWSIQAQRACLSVPVDASAACAAAFYQRQQADYYDEQARLAAALSVLGGGVSGYGATRYGANPATGRYPGEVVIPPMQLYQPPPTLYVPNTAPTMRLYQPYRR